MAGDSTLSTVTHVIVVSILWSFMWGGAVGIALENEDLIFLNLNLLSTLGVFGW